MGSTNTVLQSIYFQNKLGFVGVFTVDYTTRETPRGSSDCTLVELRGMYLTPTYRNAQIVRRADRVLNHYRVADPSHEQLLRNHLRL